MSKTHTKATAKSGKVMNKQNISSWYERHGLDPIADKTKKIYVSTAKKSPFRIKATITTCSKRASGTGSKYIFLSNDDSVKIVKYPK